MSRREDEFYLDLPGDEVPAKLDLLPYAIAVGRLLHATGALARWRSRCHESYVERCERQARLDEWNQQRAKYLRWAVVGRAVPDAAPRKGWVLARQRVFSPDGSRTALVSAWVPRA